MNYSPEQLNDQIKQAKAKRYSPDSLISALISIPKAKIPQADLLRVKSQILDRISLPATLKNEKVASGFLGILPRILRISGSVVGAFTILLSLTVGTAAAALESVPGQAIYPVKKIVENVRWQLARSEEQRTSLEIKFANNRIDELEAILKKQKEGKISEAEVQKVLADTTSDIEKTSQSVNDSTDENKLTLLTKIVDLSNKQSAVIQAAQLASEGTITIELEKALESSKLTKEQAIANIEEAGLVVEEQPLTMEDAKNVNENAVTTEGKLTALTTTSVNIGTVQFLLTSQTEYVNINPVDLKVGVMVKISGEVKDKKTYALKIESESSAETETETTETTEPTTESEETTQSPTQTIPVDPAD